jgi:uncharacterized protein YigE (DUF2233 family)
VTRRGLARRLWTLRRALAAVAAALAPATTRAAAQANHPDGITFQQIRWNTRLYQVVRVDLDRADVRLYWKDERGRPFGSLEALDRWLSGRGETLLAATNAGIFYRSREPAGLHVERGAVLRPLNRSSSPPPGEAEGNFFAQPNGVFYIADDGTAHIRATQGAALALARMREATQSGPLLLERGRQHRLIGNPTVARNAIAVCTPRRIALVLAPEGASIRDLAGFIRGELQCQDALYLDGAISGLRVPSARVNRDGSYVGIIGVTARRPSADTPRP